MIGDYELKNIPLHPDTLCNMDETLLQIASNGKAELELVPRGEATGTRSSKDPSVVGSMLVFVNASGDVPFVYFCMKKVGKAKKYPVPIIPTNRSTRNSNAMKLMGSAYSWSETGYVAEHHIEEAISKFSVIMREHWGHTKYPVVLLADNLQQHQSLNTLELSAKNKIVLQMLTPNASHYLQPLDDKLFAIFKDQLEI
jgi:hypothetical protein